MDNRSDFIHETLLASQEIFGGSPAAWVAKIAWGVGLALVQSVEAATVAIATFLVLCILDAILGLMKALKHNRTPGTVNIPIKPWRMISGPASKWTVGGVVLLAGSFFDNVMFGQDAFVHGPVLKFFTGVVLGAIIIEVTAKADYLQGWGITDRLRKRFPEFFKDPDA